MSLPVDSIIQGDCLDVLRGMEANSIDALVTDPPSGIAFMGQNWDHDKGGRQQWVAWLCSIMREALRVVKPGGHALVWALPRTSHWTATALEDAGWEIRDVITHAFGSGFPKSLDISKAIDKQAGAEREVSGWQKATGNARGKGAAGHYANGIPSLTGDGYEVVKDGWNITAPATPEAQRWHGWGSALKPASEHWILARKPLACANLASNVLEWGTGGLNIDSSRVGYADGNIVTRRANNVTIGGNGIYGGGKAAITGGHDQGRWPPNFLLSHSEHCTPLACSDECAVRLLDEQAVGTRASKPSGTGHVDPGNGVSMFWGAGGRGARPMARYDEEDVTGPSRFFPVFYCSKASKRDRSSDGAVQNTHPTCKNTTLMRWLVRLITPHGGTVLDCFAGSGSTLVACVQEGFHFLGVEQDAGYVEIARARVAAAHPELRQSSKPKRVAHQPIPSPDAQPAPVQSQPAPIPITSRRRKPALPAGVEQLALFG